MADFFEQQKKKGEPIAGVIIEPIQSEGGDNHASPEFFQQLQKVTKQVSFEPFLVKIYNNT